MIVVNNLKTNKVSKFSKTLASQSIDAPIQNLSKYIQVRVEENSDYVGWAEKDLVSGADLQLGHDQSGLMYLFGTKILGIATNNTSNPSFMIKLKKKSFDSIDNHLNLDMPVLDSVQIYEQNGGNGVSGIELGSLTLIESILFSNSSISDANTIEDDESITFVSNALASNPLSDGRDYILKISLSQQSLGRYDDNFSSKIKINADHISTDKLYTIPNEIYSYRGSNNTSQVKIKHDWSLMNLKKFNRFVLTVGNDVIDTNDNPNAIEVNERGMVNININNLLSSYGVFDTTLTAYSDAFPNGVDLWRPDLNYSSVRINVLSF